MSTTATLRSRSQGRRGRCWTSTNGHHLRAMMVDDAEGLHMSRSSLGRRVDQTFSGNQAIELASVQTLTNVIDRSTA
jgi:hypothetical protein